MPEITYRPSSNVAGGVAVNDITMEIVHYNRVEREAVYNRAKTTYLYTRWTFDLICQYNPAATTYNGSIPMFAGQLPTQAVGRTAGLTDASLRHWLMQPRGRLNVDMGGATNWIRSPMDGYTVDARNGPEPEFCNIITVHGDKTITVHYRITTWVNECSNRRSVSPLLSHTWTRRVDVDQDHFSTLVTDGEAIFRVDELARNGWHPDMFRNALMHPVPSNCQRYGIQVVANEDRTGVTYSFIDQELAFNLAFVSQGTTRIEAYQSHSFQMGNAIRETLNTSLSILSDAASITSNFYIGPAGTTGVGTAVAIGLSTVGNLVRGALNILPAYGSHFLVRSWGNRNSSRNSMMWNAFSYILGQMPRGLANCASEFTASQEHHGKMVEVQANFTYGFENIIAGTILGNRNINLGQIAIPVPNLDPGPLLNAIQQAFDPRAEIMGYFPNNENIGFFSQNAVANPAPANSRGTLLENLVAQALSGSCVVPPAPALTAASNSAITR